MLWCNQVNLKIRKSLLPAKPDLINPFMNNIPKMVGHTLKSLQQTLQDF